MHKERREREIIQNHTNIPKPQMEKKGGKNVGKGQG